MKQMILASLVGGLIASTAHAADVVYDPVPPAPPVATVYDWSGIYVGLQGGWGGGDSNVDDNGLTALDTSFDVDGGFLGGVVGAQWQYGSVVLGLEGEMNWSDIDGDTDVGGNNIIGTEINWFGSANLKLGYAWDRILLYGTGGVAYANIDTSQDFLGIDFSESEDHIGYTLGAGIDYAVTDAVIVGAQYRYYDFGDSDYIPRNVIFTPRDQDVDLHTISAHVSYKF